MLIMKQKKCILVLFIAFVSHKLCTALGSNSPEFSTKDVIGPSAIDEVQFVPEGSEILEGDLLLPSEEDMSNAMDDKETESPLISSEPSLKQMVDYTEVLSEPSLDSGIDPLEIPGRASIAKAISFRQPAAGSLSNQEPDLPQSSSEPLLENISDLPAISMEPAADDRNEFLDSSGPAVEDVFDFPELSPDPFEEKNMDKEVASSGLTDNSNVTKFGTSERQRAAGGRLSWKIMRTRGMPVARHEACYVKAPNGNHYLIGGRGKKNVGIYNPATKTWTSAPGPGIEIHHMQCVASGDGRIWIPTSWYGGYPREKNHATIFLFNTKTRKWSRRPGLPAARRRGSATAVIRGGIIYVSHGNR